MKEKTAVQKGIDNLQKLIDEETYPDAIVGLKIAIDELIPLLKLEKKQHGKTWDNGYENGVRSDYDYIDEKSFDTNFTNTYEQGK